MEKLFELDRLARKDAERYPLRRFIYDAIMPHKGRQFLSLIGPRGVGKTVLLRQIAAQNPDSFYLSMDSFEEESLFEFAKTLSEKYKIKTLLIDEIHFYKNYQADLKMIYDFLDIDLIFTSSVSLSLFESSYDLSRRVKILKIYPFSFREYIYFRENTLLDPLTISDIYNENFKAEYLRYGYLFKEYITGGIFPFSLEGIDVIETLRNVLEKVITRDIPSLSDITVAETNLIKDTFRFISLSTSEGINYSSISKNVDITKYKAQQYIQLLEKVFIINQVLPYGTNVMREPKILLAPPFRLINNEYSSMVGYLREDFVVEALKMRDFEVFYLKSMRGEKTPDFFISEKNTRYVIEVGGKGKGRSQFKGFSGYKKIVLSDTENLSKKGHKPIYLIGYI